MAAAHALFEPQTFKQLAYIIEPNGRVSGAAEKAPKRFLSSHDDILQRVILRHGLTSGSLLWRFGATAQRLLSEPAVVVNHARREAYIGRFRKRRYTKGEA